MGKRSRNYSESESCSSDDSTLEDTQSRGADSLGSGGSQEPRKRGRGPSKRPCLNKNALMARVNRQRKKEYLEKIETKLAYYRKGNKNLASVIQQQGIDLKRLTAEVTYLRNVLNNNTSITALLGAMNASLKHGKIDNGKSDDDTWDSEKPKTRSIPTKGFPYKLPDSSTGPAPPGITCDPSLNGLTFPSPNGNANDCNQDSQLELLDVDIDRLDAFDSDAFDTPTSAETNHGLDLLFGGQDNLFDNLDNSGICLHVNSGRISLEYCSICHLNSINADDP